VAGYHGPAPIDLSMLIGKKITPEDRKWQREGELCMSCGDSSNFAAGSPTKLKVVSGQMEINLFKEDLGKEKNKEEESGKV
jgi:hypothetical protein